MNILLLTPLKIEFDSLILRLHELGFESIQSYVGKMKILEFPKLGWKCSVAGHGKAQFGIQTQLLISHFKEIDLIICAGTAGSLLDQVSVFDVVVANRTIEHDFRLKFIKKNDPEFYGDQTQINKIKNKSFVNFKVHCGDIASGDEDIVTAERAFEIRAQTSAIAVAWEGAGAARASLYNHIPFLEVRGISDSSNSATLNDFSKNLKIVMSNVGDVLLCLEKY
ncbi:MAG: 5'-methylthioadenosine/S-adenosylhomocysteine nucleosidase [Pseudobdellovibrio sp.]